MINIRSRRAQRQAHREFILIMMRFERSLFYQLNIIIKRQYKAASIEVRNNKLQRIDWSVDKYTPQMEKLFLKFYQKIIVTFADRAMSEVKKSYSIGETKGQVEDLFWSRQRRWVRKNAADKATTIGMTTKKKIRKIIDEGMTHEIYDDQLGVMVQSPLTNTQLATSISLAGKIEKWRAFMIARTETHTAAVMSTQEAVETAGSEVGVKWNKYWSNALDDRTRDTHIQAGLDYGASNAIPMEEKYKVAYPGSKKTAGGFDLMAHPGDPEAHPANVVNCRCVELYLPAEQNQQQVEAIVE